MKTYIQQLCVISLFVVAALVGCTTNYPTFDTSQKASLYSDQERAGTDTLLFKSKITDDTLKYSSYYIVVGMPEPYDREVAVEILETNLSEGQYGIREHVLKANNVRASVVIEFYNDESLIDSTVYVSFRVVDNEHFNVIRPMTPDLYVLNEVRSQGKPIWWYDDILGPFSLGMYGKMVSTFVSLEETNRNLYTIMGEDLGYRLEKEPSRLVNIGGWWSPMWVTVYTGTMWTKYKQAMLKNVVVPTYEYYQEHPEDGVNIPVPILME